MGLMGYFGRKVLNISAMEYRKSMAANAKSSQKTLEQRGLATITMTYPKEMGIVAVAKDVSERTGEQVSPDVVLSLRNRLKKGSSYREALLQVERADIRFKLNTLAKDLRDLFDSSEDSDAKRAKAYAAHTMNGVYRMLYQALGDEIERVRAEDDVEGEEQDADFTLVEDDAQEGESALPEAHTSPQGHMEPRACMEEQSNPGTYGPPMVQTHDPNGPPMVQPHDPNGPQELVL